MSIQTVKASQVAEFLGCDLQGQDIEIEGPRSLNKATTGTLVFLKNATSQAKEKINDIKNVLVLVTKESGHELVASKIYVTNPRLAFAQVVQHFFVSVPNYTIDKTAQIHPNACIAENVAIGAYTVIEDNVNIATGSIIGAHCHLKEQTKIGTNTTIGSNTVIGGTGYGFEKDIDGTPIRIPHIGGVTIGQEVEIGSLCSIARGTLDDTVIENNVKIDDHCFIAHNVTLGKGAFVIAGAEISGSVVVGENSWIAPQATIKNKIVIGSNATIGIGAVVIKNVEDDDVVAGNPAKSLRK